MVSSKQLALVHQANPNYFLASSYLLLTTYYLHGSRPPGQGRYAQTLPLPLTLTLPLPLTLRPTLTLARTPTLSLALSLFLTQAPNPNPNP